MSDRPLANPPQVFTEDIPVNTVLTNPDYSFDKFTKT
mgnify:CR=1 FL=1